MVSKKHSAKTVSSTTKRVGSVSRGQVGSLWAGLLGSILCGQVGSASAEFPTCTVAQGQTDSLIFGKYKIDDSVSYKGGNDRMFKILHKNIKYPLQAKVDNITGIVYVYFTIDTSGHSTDIKVIKGVRADLDKEAIRGVDLLDEWIPGMRNGQKCELHQILPIKFDMGEFPK